MLNLCSVTHPDAKFKEAAAALKARVIKMTLCYIIWTENWMIFFHVDFFVFALLVSADHELF